jgi:hypothetical protein
VIAAIYAYSYVFKNKTLSEAAPTSKQSTQVKITPSPTDTPAGLTSPTPSSQQPANTNSTIATGSFRSAPGERAAGTVHIIKVDGRNYVRFEADTNIGPSPDPIVTLGNDDRADLSINLGSLKGTKGSQNYEIPSSIDISKYSQVIIYCRSFHIPIGYANLTR